MKKTFLILINFLIYSCSNQFMTSENFEIHFEDVNNFWNVYDKVNLVNEDKIRIKIIEKEYFEKASKGLKLLIKKDGLTPLNFNKFIKDTVFFNSIRETTLKIEKDKSQIRKQIKSVQDLYPKARFSNIYFVVGQNFHGGTVLNNQMILEIQKNSKTENTKSEIIYKNNFKGMNDYNSLIPLIIHEQAHIFQKNNNKRNLLSKTISEGSADFVMFLVTNKITSFLKKTYEYGEKNEYQLWEKFKTDMNSDYTSIQKNWFYNYKRKDLPPDLGYFVGFKISEKFYNESKNKTEALEFLLDIKNYEEVLNKSKYNGGK